MYKLQDSTDTIRSLLLTTEARLCLITTALLVGVLALGFLSPASADGIETGRQVDVARFLSQASIGFDSDLLVRVQDLGLDTWIIEQVKQPATHLSPYLLALQSRQKTEPQLTPVAHQWNKTRPPEIVGKRNFSTAWMRSVLNGSDTLRQKMAWSLSQILVVSNDSSARTIAAGDYYDVLLNNAFGNFYELLRAVTFHPMMGHYLTYLENKRADVSTRPDENFAREVMQLFTIGLWELNDDGSHVLSSSGEKTPTYNIKDIENAARVFTGFQLSKSDDDVTKWDRFLRPMVLDESTHDNDEKVFFNGSLVLDREQGAKKDVEDFLKALANHKNTAPFIIRRLIQHFVTSNPSPEYIYRVVERWRETDGNLGQVIHAILMDTEARRVSLPGSGKLKEPISRLVQVITTVGCYSKNQLAPGAYPGLQWWEPNISDIIGQAPMGQPSVFNFFEPDYMKPGLLADNELYTPEFQILDDVTSVEFANYVWRGLNDGFHIGRKSNGASNSVVCPSQSLEDEHKVRKFIDHADLMMAASTLSTVSKESIVGQAMSIRDPELRLPLITLAVASTPESAVLK